MVFVQRMNNIFSYPTRTLIFTMLVIWFVCILRSGKGQEWSDNVKIDINVIFPCTRPKWTLFPNSFRKLREKIFFIGLYMPRENNVKDFMLRNNHTCSLGRPFLTRVFRINLDATNHFFSLKKPFTFIFIVNFSYTNFYFRQYYGTPTSNLE